MQTDNVSAAFPLTPEQPSVPAKISRATWAGLAISLFAMVAIRQVFVFFVPETTFASAVLKEALIWLRISRVASHRSNQSLEPTTSRRDAHV